MGFYTVGTTLHVTENAEPTSGKPVSLRTLNARGWYAVDQSSLNTARGAWRRWHTLWPLLVDAEEAPMPHRKVTEEKFERRGLHQLT